MHDRLIQVGLRLRPIIKASTRQTSELGSGTAVAVAAVRRPMKGVMSRLFTKSIVIYITGHNGRLGRCHEGKRRDRISAGQCQLFAGTRIRLQREVAPTVLIN